MKVVYSCNYGAGFILPKIFRSNHTNYNEWDKSNEIRTHPDLISYVEEHADKNGRCTISEIHNGHLIDMTDLAVIEIPDESTDFIVTEYDGLETVYYVLGGKLYEAK